MRKIKLEGQIPLDWAGERLDKTLAGLFPDYSRARLSQWVKAGALQLNADVVKLPRYRVMGGEALVIEASVAAETRMRPQAMQLDIVHEDAHIMVINKPAGLVVHPGAGNPDGTLMNGLLAHDSQLADLPRAGIVHRLDKDTSGLMVVAKTLPAHTKLVDMLSRHDVARTYEAVIKGELIAGGHVEAALGRHRQDRLRQAVRDEDAGGKYALTRYRLRERFRAHALVECQLETGRTHQIRVHMAHIRHGLVGDPLYGGSVKLPPQASQELKQILRTFPRQALHAEKLGFVHPVTGEDMAFGAPRPADMQQLIELLQQDRATHGDRHA